MYLYSLYLLIARVLIIPAFTVLLLLVVVLTVRVFILLVLIPALVIPVFLVLVFISLWSIVTRDRILGHFGLTISLNICWFDLIQ